MINLSVEMYRKKMAINLFIGIFLGLFISIVFFVGYNLTRDPKISESGITVLLENDKAVWVSKGTVIDGDAREVINLYAHEFIKDIKTPYVADEGMLIKCDDGVNSACVLYNTGKYDLDLNHKEVINKILK